MREGNGESELIGNESEEVKRGDEIVCILGKSLE